MTDDSVDYEETISALQFKEGGYFKTSPYNIKGEAAPPGSVLGQKRGITAAGNAYGTK